MLNVASSLCLGGNVFGWTLDRAASAMVLDAYVARGGRFLDTSDNYSAWVDGNSGGESERLIGAWIAARGNRDELFVATKVGQRPGHAGLAPANIRAAAEGSLRRLGLDYVDLYYAHIDDRSVPLEASLTALHELVERGLVRHLGASNFSGARLEEARAVALANGLTPFAAVQPEYNLMDRRGYEEQLAPVCARLGLSVLPYYALAQGFLAGKYRAGAAVPRTARAADASAYLADPRSSAVLSALDGVAEQYDATAAAVAIAWLARQPAVLAPIASATSRDQVEELMDGAALPLGDEALARLSAASAYA